MRKSRLDSEHQKRLIEYFVSGTTTGRAASLVGVNKNTVCYYFQRLRKIINQGTENASPLASEIEVDESYCGGMVYTKVIPDTKGATLKAIMEDRLVPDSIVYYAPAPHKSKSATKKEVRKKVGGGGNPMNWCYSPQLRSYSGFPV